ncbi:galactose-1-phosphate uridylyltransferase [Frankia sp. Cr1]|uniref:galactose-1-phosphate uridylyltransferase n=1 Tax=Frankia sp. Cr1 TaxID=3073931 RepID=UPI002AD279A2|nr:galactose-1-phosphate uridylyltransferase [Frankia sp. Cr1]
MPYTAARYTAARMADGRDLFYYYDDAAVPVEGVPPDSREATTPTPASELRYDVLLDEWVVIAAHRQSRTHLPASDECPLCPSTAERATEIPASAYDVVVFQNRFPSFAPGDSLTQIPGDDLLRRRPGAGRCEVVCFTSDHTGSFCELPPERVRTIVQAWADRTAALGREPDVEQVFVFENRGSEIGTTLHHPHGQIYGYPFITPRTRTMFAAARRHLSRTGRNLFSDVLAAEIRADVRVVTRGVHWTAFVPAAARWPFEVHIYPHRQVPDLPSLNEAERRDLCRVYVDVLHRLDAVLGMPMPYVAAWHQAPVRVDRDLAYLHLQLFSIRRAANKLKHLAGSEAGMGAFINDIAPEHAARMLRKAHILVETVA